MSDQAIPGAQAAPAPAAQPGQPDPAAVAAAWKEARANRPGLRFTQLPPNVAALYAQAAPAASAPAQASDTAGAPQGNDPPAGIGATQDPADAAIAHAAETFGGDNAPVSAVDAMKARVEIAHQLQVADEIPGLDAGTANQYGKMLATALENPPTRAQKLQAAAESTRALQWRYPNGKDKQILADAQAELKQLAARIPKLPGLLERTGGGNDMGIIIRLAERHAQRAAARIASAARRG